MSDSNVYDFNQKRKQSIEQKRRTFERVVFDEFLGVDAIVDDNETGFPVKLIDISTDGLQFQIPYGLKVSQTFRVDTDFTLKLFFSKNSYLPVLVKIRHVKEFVDQKGDKYWRCGAVFDKALPSYQAVLSLAEFIKKYAEFSRTDSISHKVYFL
jgi:hypothetical protein